MCRLAAHLGTPTTLHALLVEPPHSLYHQAYAPRTQVSGTVNADGFGVAWYDRSRRPEPAVHKSARSIWADRSFESFSGIVSSDAVVGVVRGATAPAPVEDSGAQPFASGMWAFAHNGAVDGFRSDGAASRLRRRLTERRDAEILSASDSEVLFALVLDRLDAGMAPGPALADVVVTVDAEAGGRLNTILTDGSTLYATRWGDSLNVRSSDGAVQIGSEPFDDDPAWETVPDRHLLTATADERTITPIPMTR